MINKEFHFKSLYQDCYQINNIKCETKKEYSDLIKKIKNDAKEKNLDKNEIKKKIKEIKFFLIKHYLNKIDLILEKFQVTKTKFENNKNLILEKQIVYNYYYVQRNYFIQKKIKNPKCDESIINYFNASLRILEFAIYVNFRKIEYVKKICFNKKEINICFYSYFAEIKDEISSKNRYLIKCGKAINSAEYNGKNVIYIDYNNSYIPISIINTKVENDNNNSMSWFARYFIIENKQVNDIFNGIGSKGSYASKGPRGKRKLQPLDSIDFLDENIYNSNTQKEKNQSLENSLENTQNADTIATIALLDNKYAIGIKIRENYTNSSYKNFLIDKKISNNMAKNDMFLYSKAPNINTLKELITKILEEDSSDKKEGYHRKLILLSFFTGISIDNLIDSLCYNIKEIQFEKQYYLKIKAQNNIFAIGNEEDNKILIKIQNNNDKYTTIVYLPNILQNIIYHIKNAIKNKKNIKTMKEEEYKNFKKDQFKICNKILGNSKKKLNKSIYNVKAKSIHKLFFHYYHLTYGITDTGILPLYKISNSNKARVCYVVQPQRAIYYEKWMIEFLRKFTEKNIPNIPNISNKYLMIGSPKVVRIEAFKLFLENIVKLPTKNKIERFNLKMIFIRYALSVLLATRDFNTSCELLEFSEKYRLLTIHEKAKHVNSSKRLIKVSPLALDYIKLFFELKQEFNYDGYIPILIKLDRNKNYKFVDFNKDNILNFLKKYSQNKRYEQVVSFIKTVQLNFGRHVFATESLNNELKKDYENEFLGHYSKGNLGFGIFSNMKIETYLKTSEKFMRKIEKKYFNKKISPRNIK